MGQGDFIYEVIVPPLISASFSVAPNFRDGRLVIRHRRGGPVPPDREFGVVSTARISLSTLRQARGT